MKRANRDFYFNSGASSPYDAARYVSQLCGKSRKKRQLHHSRSYQY